MKKNLRLLSVSLIIFMTLFANIPGFAATVLKKIDVELNAFTVKVNSKALEKDNIVYKGNVYIRADKVSSAFGKTIKTDSKTKTVTIDDVTTPKTTGYSYSNPAPINTLQTIKNSDLLQTYSVEAKVKEIIRGDKAWEMVKEANMFNSEPKEGYEYLLAKIYFKVNDIDKDQQFDLNSTSFTLVSSGGKDYELLLGAMAPDPQLSASLYKGHLMKGGKYIWLRRMI